MSIHWELTPVVRDSTYIPDAQELAEMEEIEARRECKHENYDSLAMAEGDGCPDCGYGSK